MEKPILTIDYRNFILGESSQDRVPDKGFSPNSYNLNLTKERGTVYFAESGTDRGSGVLVDDIIASTFDPSSLGNDAYYLDEAGNFYTLSGSTFTKRQTGVKTYIIGTSEIISFKSSLYATSTTDIAKLDGSNITTMDEDWWTATLGKTALQTGVRHPLEVLEDVLYIGDGNLVHTWDGTTGVHSAMILPTGVNITSLRKHPDGKHLIAFCGETINYSHTRGGGAKAYIIDTVNLEFVNEVDLESQVEGSRLLGGIVFVTYGKNLGYFTGDGIAWIRTLLAGTTYSHCLGNIEDHLIVRDLTEVLAYGDLGGGKVWRNIYHAEGTITNVQYKGDNKLLVSFNASGAKLYEIDYANASIYGRFITNHQFVGSRIAIRRVEITHTKTPVSGTNSFYLSYINEEGAIEQLANFSYVNNPQIESRIDVDIFTAYLQLMIFPSQGGMGFREIRVYGDSIE